MAIEWGWEGINPAIGIKHFKAISRERFVQPEEMPFLIRALDQMPQEKIRDYF